MSIQKDFGSSHKVKRSHKVMRRDQSVCLRHRGQQQDGQGRGHCPYVIAQLYAVHESPSESAPCVEEGRGGTA